MHNKSHVSVSRKRILARVTSRPCCSLPLNIMIENCHQVATITITITNPEILAWFEHFDSATACPGRVYSRPVCPIVTKSAPEKYSSGCSLSYTQTYPREKPNPASHPSWSPSPVPFVHARG